MANWSASNKICAVEGTHLVAYPTYTSDDAEPRTIKDVRTSGETKDGILLAIARECGRLKWADERIATVTAELALCAGVLDIGVLALPDISKQLVIAAASHDLMAAVSAALVQPGTNVPKDRLIAAAAIDPTVNDKLAVLQAALGA